MTNWFLLPSLTRVRFTGLVYLTILLLLEGCAHKNSTFQVPASTYCIDEPFAVAGRLAINMRGRGQVAHFDWRHTPSRDELEIKTPLGTTVARLVRDANGAVLETKAGERWHASDVDTLTVQQLGWPLPMSNLVWWVRGRPAPLVEVQVQADGGLLQQGWTIRFFTDKNSHAIYPKRIELWREQMSVRLVLQEWH